MEKKTIVITFDNFAAIPVMFLKGASSEPHKVRIRFFLCTSLGFVSWKRSAGLDSDSENGVLHL